eukprot:TRINITY_DN1724_c0_g2_i1.p1 TRINITY_DN1724_c0_g2~~TRINITY_DN1724_c0_g2_i1.p1  ORF type:complete len:388 (-),score=121.00 TRINITY_DN1724_c0_g2_i1:216-1379(-)
MSVKTATNAQPSYTFTSSPRALKTNRKPSKPLYREDEPTLSATKNIHNDPRVKRGTTIKALSAAQAQKIIKETEDAAKEARRQERLKRQREALANRPATPEPVSGRTHIEIQTDEFLVEISDRPIEKEIETQTDPFFDRPPTPVFVPQKSGVDVETQILEGDLFDFDREVEPVLSVLVAKTLEQSMLEVREEEELAAMVAHQKEFMFRRAEELAEAQRLEDQERRREEEKARRVKQESERLEREIKQREQAEARNIAHKFLQDLQPTVFNTLNEVGYFYDPVLRDVESNFVPWLLDSSVAEVSKQQLARKLLDDLLKAAAAKGQHRYEEAVRLARELELLKAKQKEEQEQREREEKERIARELAEKLAQEENEEEGAAEVAEEDEDE